MNNNDIKKIKNGGIIGHNDQRDDKESGNEVGCNNWNEIQSNQIGVGLR